MIEKSDILALVRIIALAASGESGDAEKMVAWAYQQEPKEEKKKRTTPAEKVSSESIERLYSYYPTKCPVSGRSTGKSSKDKRRIEVLLRTRTEGDLEHAIKTYVSDCIGTRTYIKNFATFLNNVPDYSEKENKKPSNPQASFFDVASGGFNF